jgi:hypothetical protein
MQDVESNDVNVLKALIGTVKGTAAFWGAPFPTNTLWPAAYISNLVGQNGSWFSYTNYVDRRVRVVFT